MTKRVGSADAGNPERRLASGPGVIDDGRGVPGWAVTMDGDREPVSLAPVLTPVAGGIEGARTVARLRSAVPGFPFSLSRSLESAWATDAGIASGNALGLSLRVVPRRCAGTGWQLDRSERQSVPVPRGPAAGYASGDCRAGQGVVEGIRRSRRDCRVAAKRLASLFRGRVCEQPLGERACPGRERRGQLRNLAIAI
jgi:hypothetical protein